MRSTCLAAVLLAVAAPAVAAPADDGANRWFSPRLDRSPVTVTNALTGQTWSAWSYSAPREFDLALSLRSADGRWSAPVFFGTGDGVDQIDPSLLVDARGVVYVAYAERGTGRIQIAALPSPATPWRTVATIQTAGGTVASPSMKVVGDRLVLAFRSANGTEIHDLPLFGATSGLGIDDGPDPFGNGSRGNDGGGDKDDESQHWRPAR